MLILAQTRANRSVLQSGLREAARAPAALRDRLGRFEERMVRLAGTLDVIREFFVGSGRGTAAYGQSAAKEEIAPPKTWNRRE